MKSKIYLEQILYDIKCISDLFLHGTIESGNEKLNDLYNKSLSEMLNLQHDIYTLMSNKNMYKSTNVASSKIEKTLNKFNENLEI